MLVDVVTETELAIVDGEFAGGVWTAVEVIVTVAVLVVFVAAVVVAEFTFAILLVVMVVLVGVVVVVVVVVVVFGNVEEKLLVVALIQSKCWITSTKMFL